MEIKTYEPTDHRVRMLIYGGSGVGKTVFGATAPKPLFIAAEAGMLSLADKGAQYVTVKTMQDMRDVLKALKDNTMLDKEGKPIVYETIVIDSLTKVQDVVIENITGGRQPSMNQWGDFSDRMAEILKGFSALDKHIIFICLESEKNAEDDDGKEYTRFQPELFGKLAEKAQALMDFVGRYYMKTEVVGDRPTAKRVLTFTYSPRWKAKDRSGKMPQFADPDFSKLMSEYVKIKIGGGEVIGNVKSAIETPALPFPPNPKEELCTKEGAGEIKEAWGYFMRYYKDAAGKELTPEKHDAALGATMKKYTGVDTTTKLRKTQAAQFFDHIIAETEKIKPKDVEAPKEEPKVEEEPKAEKAEPESKELPKKTRGKKPDETVETAA